MPKKKCSATITIRKDGVNERSRIKHAEACRKIKILWALEGNNENKDSKRMLLSESLNQCFTNL